MERIAFFRLVLAFSLLTMLLVGCTDANKGTSYHNFLLTLSPNVLTTLQGQSVKATLTITPRNGFAGRIALSLVRQDGAPAPAGIRVSPVSVEVVGDTPTSVTLTISVSEDVEPGTYELRLVGRSGELEKSVDFTLRVEARQLPIEELLTGWEWRAGGNLNAIAYSPELKKFVAVGENGLILVSEDAWDWRRIYVDLDERTHLHDVIYANGHFIAVGANGPVASSGTNILISEDGEGWQVIRSVPLSTVTYGMGYYWAAGPDKTVLRSKDAYSWEPVEITINQNINYYFLDLTYANGVFVAVAGGGGGPILRSVDGVSWEVVLDGNYYLKQVKYLNEAFIAVGFSGRIYYSTDGYNWQTYDAPTNGNGALRDIAFNGTTYVAVGDLGTIVISDDLKSWSKVEADVKHDIRAVEFAEGKFIAAGTYGILLTSSDGWNWSPITVSTHRAIYGVTYGDNGYIAVGVDGVYISEDAKRWAPIPQQITSGLFAVTFGQGKYIAGGRNGRIYLSFNGTDWEDLNEHGHDLYNLKYLNQKVFVAVGHSGTVKVSYDGETWSSYDLDPSPFTGVTYGKGYYVVVGSSGDIYRSKDLTYWEEVDAPYLRAADVAFGNGKFVAVGSYGKVLVAQDSGAWELVKTGINSKLNAIVYVNNVFVAVGASGTVAVSSDGEHWISTSLGKHLTFYGIGVGEDYIVIVGDRGAIYVHKTP